MGFGKRVCEILAVLGAIVLIGALVWYFSGGMRDRGYEKEGTLVWEEQGTLCAKRPRLAEPWSGAEPWNGAKAWNGAESPSWQDEAAYPAFVTNPASRIYRDGESTRLDQSIKCDELSRSGRGL